MYEHHTQKPISRILFYFRLLKTLSFSLVVVSISLTIGIFGYHFIEGLAWIDSLLNASMILGGMGPVDPMKSEAGKLFASFYALFSGLVLVGLMGILLAPVFHRILHHTLHEAEQPEK